MTSTIMLSYTLMNNGNVCNKSSKESTFIIECENEYSVAT